MEPIDQKKGAKLLRRLRRKYKVSRTEFCEYFHFKPKSNIVSQLEYGHLEFSELWARRCGEFFNLPWQDFYEEDKN